MNIGFKTPAVTMGPITFTCSSILDKWTLNFFHARNVLIQTKIIKEEDSFRRNSLYFLFLFDLET